MGYLFLIFLLIILLVIFFYSFKKPGFEIVLYWFSFIMLFSSVVFYEIGNLFYLGLILLFISYLVKTFSRHMCTSIMEMFLNLLLTIIILFCMYFILNIPYTGWNELIYWFVIFIFGIYILNTLLNNFICFLICNFNGEKLKNSSDILSKKMILILVLFPLILSIILRLLDVLGYIILHE